MEAAQHPWPALGALLLRDGLVDKDELEAVLALQDDAGHHRISARRLGELLVERGTVTHALVAQLLAEQYELPYIELSESDVNLRAAGLLSEELATRFSALPVSVLPDGSVLVAVSDPPLVLFSDEFRRLLGVPLRYAVAAQDEVEAAIAYAGDRAAETGASEIEAVEVPDLAAYQHDADTEAEPEPLLTVAEPSPAHRSAALGALLLRDELVTEEDLDAALAQQRIANGKRLGEILVERGVVTREQVARLVAEQYDLPFVELELDRVDREASALLSEEVARRLSVLPLGSSADGSLLVVVADPTNVVYADEVRLALEAPIRFAVACPDVIQAAITHAYDGVHELEPEEPEPAEEPEEREEPADAGDEVGGPSLEVVVLEADDEPIAADDDPDAEETVAEVEDPVALEEPDEPHEDEAADDGVVDDRVAEDLQEAIRLALSLDATSIHFSPQPDGLVVRARIEGSLQELGSFPPDLAQEATKRLLELARLEPSALPRRGILQLGAVDDALPELTVTTLPTRFGDHVTLDVSDAWPLSAVSELALPSEVEGALLSALRARGGAIVVCAPPLSGRTTTLYAALHQLATPERALATIEEPAAPPLSGVSQVEVDRAAGLTPAAALRGVFRADPDVVLVDDVRDGETARLAFRGARTSNVLLGLEADTAVDGVDRLLSLGVEPSLLASALSCVLSQRLVRRVCAECRETYYASAEEIAELGRPEEESGRRLLARGRGCETCDGSGYEGWTAVFEVLPLSDEVRALVRGAASADAIRLAAELAGVTTMREAAVGLCLDGVTTVAEVRLLPS